MSMDQGFRMLDPHETVEEGDQYQDFLTRKWYPIPKSAFGRAAGSNVRRITDQAAFASYTAMYGDGQ